MRLILSILASLLILTGNAQGMPRIPFDKYTETLLEGAVSEEELHHYLQQQDNGCAFTSPSYGGTGGNTFDELPANCTAIVKTIVIRAATYVNDIQIMYQLPDGSEQVGGYHGAGGGSESLIKIDVANGERITGIFGRSYDYVNQVGFVTNQGRIFGPYGGCGGNPFNVDSCNIGGIYGRSYDWMDSIGFYCNNP